MASLLHGVERRAFSLEALELAERAPLAEVIDAEVAAYSRRFADLAEACVTLPQAWVDLRRLVAVPRLLSHHETLEHLTAQLSTSPDLGGLQGGPALAAFFCDELARQLDAALSSPVPTIRRPVRSHHGWLVVGRDATVPWVTHPDGAEWRGHYFVYESPRRELRRSARRALADACQRLQRQLEHLSRRERQDLVRAAQRCPRARGGTTGHTPPQAASEPAAEAPPEMSTASEPPPVPADPRSLQASAVDLDTAAPEYAPLVGEVPMLRAVSDPGADVRTQDPRTREPAAPASTPTDDEGPEWIEVMDEGDTWTPDAAPERDGPEVPGSNSRPTGASASGADTVEDLSSSASPPPIGDGSLPPTLPSRDDALEGMPWPPAFTVTGTLSHGDTAQPCRPADPGREAPVAALLATPDLIAMWGHRLGRDDRLIVLDGSPEAPVFDVIAARHPPILVFDAQVAMTPRTAVLIRRLRADPRLAEVRCGVLSYDEHHYQVSPWPDAWAALVAEMGDPAAADGRRAVRLRLPDRIPALVNHHPVTLVDLSVCGAQVVSPTRFPPNGQVSLVLPATEGALTCEARIVWATFERAPASGVALYRAGLAFRALDPGTVLAVCIRPRAELVSESAQALRA